MSFHIRRPSAAMVVACAALLVSLGGVGVAATSLPRNSVGQLQLRPNAVTSSKIADGSLRGVDFASGTLLRGPTGAQGPAGAPGLQGKQGPAGASTGGGRPSGAAGGGLTGAYPNPQIAANVVGSAQVIDNGLTGVDVNESTLAQVPSALTAVLGGLGRLTSTYPFGGTFRCVPPSTNAYDACAQIVVDLPTRSRVLLLGRISGRPFQAGNSSAQYGICRIGHTGAAPAGPSVRFIADKEHEAQAQGTLIGLSPPLGPGRATFTIDCAQGLQGVRGFQFEDAVLAAVALSPS